MNTVDRGIADLQNVCLAISFDALIFEAAQAQKPQNQSDS